MYNIVTQVSLSQSHELVFFFFWKWLKYLPKWVHSTELYLCLFILERVGILTYLVPKEENVKNDSYLNQAIFFSKSYLLGNLNF